MFVYSCGFAMPNWFGRGEHGIEVKQAHTTQVRLDRVIRLFYLFLFCSLSGVAQANDIELSGLIQRPTNPLPVGTSANYNLTLHNVDDGINPPSIILVGIRVIVDGVTIRADSGELEASGCTVDISDPSDFTCNALGVGGSLSPTFIWHNPTPGNHSVTFRASCQTRLQAETGLVPCASSGASLSTTTMVGVNPTAVLNPAGPTVTIEDTAPSVNFDGLSSTVQNGTVASCEFRMDGGQFVGTADCHVEYPTPSPGDHTVELQVTDNNGLTDITSLTLRVLSYPEADSGGNQQLTDTDNDGTETVTLDASASSDVGGTIVSYEWFEFDVSGSPLASGVTANLALAVGTHNVTLRVTDNDGMVTEDPFTVTILAGSVAPTANAGVDQQLIDSDNNSTELVQLDGTASADTDGTIVSYQWLEFDSEVASGATPSITLAVGSHNLTLRVTDNDGAVGEDQVSIVIQPGSNAPRASAGIDQQLIDADNDNSENVALDGSGSEDLDGSIVNYQWLESGMEVATGATPTVSLSVGVHTLTLRVTDNDNLFAEDQVVIRIDPAPNAPIADAGEDLTLTDHDNDGSEQVTIDASNSSDSDGTIVSYQWFENGIEIANTATATVNLTVGVHSLTLRVVDSDDLVSEDQLTVSVAAVLDVSAPIAHAGLDQSVVDSDGDGIESVTLDGSASTDSDGTIIHYTWFEGDREIANGATAEVDLTTGTHTLTLLVTDDTQLTNQDQVMITVSSAEAQLQIVSGNRLSGGAGETVGPFTVRLVDQSGAPVADQSIVWRVTPDNAASLS
ncbi:MAG: PKD domain-containing protein, partial [Candidatus Thiodiazotropha sp.]